MKWRRSVNGVTVAIPRLAAKPIVAKPNVDCIGRVLNIGDRATGLDLNIKDMDILLPSSKLIDSTRENAWPFVQNVHDIAKYVLLSFFIALKLVKWHIIKS